ncbi:helix-turn-helix transcriptional regulator [Aerococcaceae bacterium zg-ZJ1578]|uniref:helix-turn-helix transcriptional regulator n=1 Tax=Aerococcaceae bacterium zg-252 TaxID=2796928 RepID=UPI001A26621A|nr:helix-turn-helix transcriptional regulator [Aerococcaceae bacterium zg-1578]
MKLKIKEIRLAKGMTQKEVYINICSRKQYSRIENNQCETSLYFAASIAKRLGVVVEEIIEFEDYELNNINDLSENDY